MENIGTTDYGTLVISLFSILISIGSFIISLITFFKKRKSDQFHILLNIQDRLDKATHLLEDAEQKYQEYAEKYVEIQHKSKQQLDMNEIKKIQRGTLNSSVIGLLDLYEYFSFLVLNGEINHKDVIDFVKSRFQRHIDMSYNIFPEYKNNDNVYPRIKKLLKKWEDEKNCVND